MANATIVHSTDAEFQETVLDSEVPVLVDFWASWCQPCRALTPHLDALANRFEGRAKIVKMDVDSNPTTPGDYGVRGIPTLLVFKGGKVVDQLVGNPGALGPLEDLVRRNLQ